ncbi:hypothetical protein LTR74_012685 [Friedmanniomyces endolithicus]|nr:hypothetical protein LTR74_012685 [Friedmanniomyces endolithicus]
MAFNPNVLAAGKESTDRTATETPSTYATKDKETVKLLAVVVNHARSAENGRYGRAVIENEHIAMMNVDGTLNWIGDSFSEELVQTLNVSVAASNDNAAKSPEPLRNRPDSAPIPTGPAASRALPGSKCRRTRRGGRNHRKKADGTPRCISASQGGETVQSTDAALAICNDGAAGTPEPLQNRLETAQIFTTQSAPKTDYFPSSRRLDFLIGMNR